LLYPGRGRPVGGLEAQNTLFTVVMYG
jgi:hypothetical protein